MIKGVEIRLTWEVPLRATPKTDSCHAEALLPITHGDILEKLTTVYLSTENSIEIVTAPDKKREE